MEEYFKINNQFKKYLPVFLMMLSLILLLGTSYALIKNGNKGENSYVVNIGSLEVTFVDSETDNLVLDNMVPMSDTDGANQSDELSVTIENTGGAYAQYNIYIEETSSDVEFKSQIRFITNKNNTGYGTVKTLSEDKYIDIMGELNASETATYKVKVWLSEDADSTYMDKTFKARLVIDIVESDSVNFSDTFRSVLSSKTATTSTDTDGTIYISGSTDIDSTTANTDVNYNYVWYSGKLWRIVALYSDDTMKLVTNSSMVSMDMAENVTYKDSYIDQWLNQEFLPTLYNYNDFLVMDYAWNVTTATTFTSMPAKTTMVEAPVGLLNGYEYYKSYEKATAAKSYLNQGYPFWIGTQYNTTKYVYVNASGALANIVPYEESYGVRPSIVIKNDVEIKAGDGTLTNPYRFHGDNGKPIYNTTKLNTRQSGEYVKFNDILFRIVSVEDNTTKLVTDDYLKDGTTVLTKYFTTSANVYGNGASTTYWDYYLKTTWYNTFDTTEKSMMVNGTYYVGEYGDTAHYKDAICATVSALYSAIDCRKTGVTTWTGYVGALRIGEMFASQQKSTYNDTLQIYYTITNYTSGTQRRTIATAGTGYKTPAGNKHAVRPTINISSLVKITGGTGLKEDPFTISL